MKLSLIRPVRRSVSQSVGWSVGRSVISSTEGREVTISKASVGALVLYNALKTLGKYASHSVENLISN